MDTLSVLSEPTRREIVNLLSKNGQMTASDIYENFDSTAPAISQHLKVLKQANLVDVQKQAQKRIYKINPKANDLIREFMMLWNNRFSKLEEVLNNE